MEIISSEVAFPRLSNEEMDVIRANGTCRRYRDGEVVVEAGDHNVDFYVVESGSLQIINPADNDREVTVHHPHEFTGDIDLLTRRPSILSAIARGETMLVRVPGNQFRELLGKLPRLAEKLIVAFQIRRQLLQQAGVAGVKIVGKARCPATTILREFLHRNFLPFAWTDSDTPEGLSELERLGKRDGDLPVVECRDGTVLANPTLGQLARAVGVQQPCPNTVFDVAIIGSGPAGMTAGVYAASEGLSTVVLDRLGPGGQAGGSSVIENFIGFPSGLSGTELATRGVLQMLKFGALLLAPVEVKSLEHGAEHHTIFTSDDQAIRARIILIACGATWRRREVENAERFERAGVYYAATAVEARLCTGQQVAVVGGGNSGGQAAMYLSECSAGVHFILRGELGPGMSEYLVNRIRNNPHIQVHTQTSVTRILGDTHVSGIEIRSESGQESTIDCSAVFVFIGAVPNSSWLPPQIARDDDGYLLTGSHAANSGKWPLEREPCELETSMPRVLAAGDVRSGATKRVAFAVGDGALAVTCIHRLLR